MALFPSGAELLKRSGFTRPDMTTRLWLPVPYWVIVGMVFLVLQPGSFAQLDFMVSDTKRTGKKLVVTLSLTNNFQEEIESTRGTIFLLDDAGKVVAQNTRWIIGGTADKQGLPSKEATKFHFVLDGGIPFSTNRFILNRVVLKGGRVVMALPPTKEPVLPK